MYTVGEGSPHSLSLCLSPFLRYGVADNIVYILFVDYYEGSAVAMPFSAVHTMVIRHLGNFTSGSS